MEFLYEGPGPLAGKNVRDDRQGIPGYPYQRASADCTVAVWISRRFKSSFPGFDVAVLDGRGRRVSGHMKLSTVRNTYP